MEPAPRDRKEPGMPKRLIRTVRSITLASLTAITAILAAASAVLADSKGGPFP